MSKSQKKPLNPSKKTESGEEKELRTKKTKSGEEKEIRAKKSETSEEKELRIAKKGRARVWPSQSLRIKTFIPVI